MSKYVLDTDIFTLFQDGHAKVVQQVGNCAADQLAITIISVEEELRGWYTRLRRAKKPAHLAYVYQRLTDAIRFFSGMEILSFTEIAIARYDQLRAEHRNVSKNDLRIAAIVLEQGRTLATRNVRDYQGIQGLKIEDWSK